MPRRDDGHKNTNMLSLCLVFFIDFFLEGLEEFIFGTGLPSSIQPVRRAGGRNQRANNSALDHSVEVSCPGLKGRGWFNLKFLRGWLILREAGRGKILHRQTKLSRTCFMD